MLLKIIVLKPEPVAESADEEKVEKEEEEEAIDITGADWWLAAFKDFVVDEDN